MAESYLIVVDMQNDFVTGSLGTKEAEQIVPAVLEKVAHFSGNVCFTMDTHDSGYLRGFQRASDQGVSAGGTGLCGRRLLRGRDARKPPGGAADDGELSDHGETCRGVIGHF